jgi:hypothetical protein
MKEVHAIQNRFKCSECNKGFVLDWRRKKHMRIHIDDVEFCNFYNNKKKCPFEDIGCMFLHETADACTFHPCLNKLCQYKHDKVIITVEEDTRTGDLLENEQITSENNTDDDEEDSLNGNKCHLCMKQLNIKDDLYHHMEVYHEDFYQGIMEVAKAMSHPTGETGCLIGPRSGRTG